MTNKWTLYLLEGIVFILLGICAILLPQHFTFAFTLLLGCLLIVGSVVQFIRAFQTRGRDFWLSILAAILYLVVGVLLLVHPIVGMLTLTLLLAVFFLLEGFIKIFMSFSLRHSRYWGWLLLSGLIAILLAALIWYQWPLSGTWFIGLMIGVYLIFFGITETLVAFSLRNKPRY